MHNIPNLFLLLILLNPLISQAQPHLPPPIEIKDGRFLAGNKQFTFHGINWFGFNNQMTMLDGLWSGGSSLSTDFSTIVYRLKLLRFNSVRIPFTFADLKLPPRDFSTSCRPLSLEEIALATNSALQSSPPPPFHGPLPNKSKQCNSYLPSKSTLDRFLWVVTHFVRNGFYVVLDYHPMGQEQIPLYPKEFVKNWLYLWNEFRKQPHFQSQLKGRILLDLMNEPDSMRIYWNPQINPPRPGVTQLYLSTMDALYSLDRPLFLIEGTGQVGYNLNWGNGFITNKTILQQYKHIDDPNPFFRALLQKPYISQVIISPHLYGPTISKSSIDSKGPQLERKLYDTFGYLVRPGYCQSSRKCHKFPLILGEFGSFFTDPRDIAYYNTMALWFKNKMPEQMNWLFWCYNANSGDTGGIVKDDWKTLELHKLEWLKSMMNL